MSLRIVPTASHAHSTLPSRGAPSAPGVHDTLRANLSLSAPPPKDSSTITTKETQSFHPLESRLSAWRTQQETLKMELLRRQFGIAEPVKRQMELSVVRAGEWTPACLGGSGMGGGASVHADILAGREAELDWEDVFLGEGTREPMDFHAEMEGRFGVGW